jgi:membrane peptidoglycan carboxypeptidase
MLQGLAQKAINDILASQGQRVRASQAALVAMRPDGAIVAMVGGRDYRQSQFNRAVQANRHPGSAFKLFVYFAALRNGYSLNDVIDAGPVQFKDWNGWEPENFGGRRYGRVTLTEAFAASINTAAVRLAMDVGLEEVIAAARDLGIDSKLTAAPSIALGAVELSLLEMTAAFASVRAGRTRIKPWGIAALAPDHETRMRAIGPAVSDTSESLRQYQQPLLELLRLVVQRGTGRTAALEGFAAGKTGTSQNHRDAWFIGFNDSLVVGVWVGNDDNSPMEKVVGGTLPAMIWKRFMTEATSLGHRPRVVTLPDRRAATSLAAAPDGPLVQAPLPLTEANGWAQAQCNVDACARKYNSFNASDCTYQPYGRGARRLCEIGEPDQAEAERTRGRHREKLYEEELETVGSGSLGREQSHLNERKGRFGHRRFDFPFWR